MNGFYEIKQCENNNIENGDIDVKKKEKEVLPVPKTDAIVDPRTVVVHIEHAPVASGAVVAPFRFENVAHQTIPAPFILRVAVVETLNRKS